MKKLIFLIAIFLTMFSTVDIVGQSADTSIVTNYVDDLLIVDEDIHHVFSDTLYITVVNDINDSNYLYQDITNFVEFENSDIYYHSHKDSLIDNFFNDTFNIYQKYYIENDSLYFDIHYILQGHNNYYDLYRVYSDTIKKIDKNHYKNQYNSHNVNSNNINTDIIKISDYTDSLTNYNNDTVFVTTIDTSYELKFYDNDRGIFYITYPIKMKIIDYRKYVEDTTSSAIQELSTQSTDFTIYPNPVNEQLHISYNTQNTYTESNVIRIYDMTGRELISTTKQTINTSTLSTGYYIIKIGNKTKYFVKE